MSQQNEERDAPCIYSICVYRRLTFFRGENIFVYKRKFENYFYEILLLSKICFKILKKFHLKIYYMKISNMKNQSTVLLYSVHY